MIVVARPIMLAALLDFPLMLLCNQEPVAAVSWSFQHSPDSEAQDIIIEGSVVSDNTDRFGIRGSNLIMYKVQEFDDGLYHCSDANGNIFRYHVTVAGEEVAVFLEI